MVYFFLDNKITFTNSLLSFEICSYPFNILKLCLKVSINIKYQSLFEA